MHNAHMYFNDFNDCFKKWCEKENYRYDIAEYSTADRRNYLLYTPEGEYSVSEYFDESDWPEYGLYFDHGIVVGTPSYNILESYCIFFSLLKFVVTNTDSDIFSFLEGGKPLLYRKGNMILSEYNDNFRQEEDDDEKLLFDELFSGLDIQFVDDADKYLGV